MLTNETESDHKIKEMERNRMDKMMIKKIVLVLIICTVWNSPITKWDPKGKKSPKAWARASRRYDPTNDDIIYCIVVFFLRIYNVHILAGLKWTKM